MVLVGAEGVVENGGVINKLGTFQAALAAQCHNIPFYVAAESYKVRWKMLCPCSRSHATAGDKGSSLASHECVCCCCINDLQIFGCMSCFQ